MKHLLALAALPLAIAGCSKDGGGNTASAAPAGSVAAVAAPAGKSWTETVAKTPEGGYRLGNPDAAIKLVEYGSRMCPTCGNFGRTGMEPLIQNYVAKGNVSYEFRDFLVHGAIDLPPTLLGQCVDIALFFPILEQTFQNQQGFGDKLQKMAPDAQAKMQAMQPAKSIEFLGEQMGLIDFFKQRGLPEAKARACLSDMTQIDRLTKQTQDASGIVTGTPTFLVNGKKLDVVTWPDVEKALKAAGA
jgi:protein-disulfide isomerase